MIPQPLIVQSKAQRMKMPRLSVRLCPKPNHVAFTDVFSIYLSFKPLTPIDLFPQTAPEPLLLACHENEP